VRGAFGGRLEAHGWIELDCEFGSNLWIAISVALFDRIQTLIVGSAFGSGWKAYGWIPLITGFGSDGFL